MARPNEHTAGIPEERPAGRVHQKRRTREALLAGARAVMERGEPLTVVAAAREHGISRATAYRYFPDAQSLALEAGMAVEVRPYETIVAGAADARARVHAVARYFLDLARDHEAQFQRFLSHRLGMLADLDGAPAPERGARRLGYFDRAVADLGLPAGPRADLVRALSVATGFEAHLVLNDVGRCDAATARRTVALIVDALLDRFAPAGEAAP